MTKHHDQFWKISLPDIIQLGMLLALMFAIYQTYVSIQEQKNFSQKALRAWVTPDFDSSSSIYFDNSGYLRFEYTITNVGQTPAFNVKSYTLLNMSPLFPESSIIQQIAADTVPRAPCIFPSISYSNISSQMLFTIDSGYVTKTAKGQFETLLVKDTVRDMDRLFTMLERVKLHAHNYVEYQDVNMVTCALRSTYYLKCKRESDSTSSVQPCCTYNSPEIIKR